MKYLKNYKLFESKFSEIEYDIKDMLLDISDTGLNFQVKEESHHAFETSCEILIFNSGRFSSLIGLDLNFYKDGLSTLDSFYLTDNIKECILTIIGYMKENNWYKYDLSIVTKERPFDIYSRDYGNCWCTDIIIKDDNLFYSKVGADANYLYTDKISNTTEIKCIRLGFGYN